MNIQCAHQTFIKYQFIYRISTYFFDIKQFNNQHCVEKTPRISKHHLPLSCKNKGNQPPLNHNNLVELEPRNTKNRFINTQFPT